MLLLSVVSLTLLAYSEKRIQALETKCKRKLLGISYLEHKTNDCVLSETNFLVDPQESLLKFVKRRKFVWFWQVTRHVSLATLGGGRRRGRQMRVDIPAHARTVHNSLLQKKKKKEDDLC